MFSRIATIVVSVSAAGLLLLTAGCSDDSEAQAPATPATTGSSPSPTASPTPTPSPTPTAQPLSRFEDEPPVIAARAWAAAFAQAINRRERTLGTAAPYSTAAGIARFQDYAKPEMGLYYPGPMPFTPTAVKVTGGRAVVETCWWAFGFAQDRKTKLPAHKRLIDAEDVILKKQGGQWKVDDLLVHKGGGDCSAVPVKGVGW